MRLAWPDLRSITPARAAALASVALRNAIPVAGIALFDWNAAHLVLIYYADTVVSIASVFTLLIMHEKDMREGIPPGWRFVAAATIGVVFLTAAFAFAMGFPVIVMDAMEGLKLDDEGLRAGLLLQMFFACAGFLTMSHELRQVSDKSARVRRRFNFVTLRWVALFVGLMFIPWAPFLVVVYAGASIWLELHPEATD